MALDGGQAAAAATTTAATATAATATAADGGGGVASRVAGGAPGAGGSRVHSHPHPTGSSAAFTHLLTPLVSRRLSQPMSAPV